MYSYNNNHQQPSPSDKGERPLIGLPRTPKKKENAPAAPGESNDDPRRLLAPLDQNMPMPTSVSTRITTVSHLSPGGMHNESHSALVTDESYHTTVSKMVHERVEGEKAARQRENAGLRRTIARQSGTINKLKQDIAELNDRITSQNDAHELLEGETAARQREIAGLRRTIDRQSGTINNQNCKIAELKQDIDEMKHMIAEMKRTMAKQP
jgi:uncharacterized coiled-coil protein SlyX